MIDDQEDNSDFAPDENDEVSTPSTGNANINPNAPDFVKNIKGLASNIPMDREIDLVPKNPFTLTTNAQSLGQSKIFQGLPDNPSLYEAAKAEYKNWNFTSQALNYKIDRAERVNPQDDPVPPGWTPKTDQEKFLNIDPQYLNYLFSATGPKDQDYRLQRIYSEQNDHEALANGSWAAKVLGGVTGAVTDPMSYIPIVGWTKYAKLTPTILGSALRSLPGNFAYSVLSSEAEQLNKINGNMSDFFLDAFTRTAMGTALFGVGGAVDLSADKLALWDMRNWAKSSMNGIDFKIATDEAGKVQGFKAVDTTGGLSAEQVSYAQDLADSSFAKQGVFKVPYLGAAVDKFLTMPIFGTPLPKLLNSPFQTMRGFIDRVAEHSIITTGIQQGKAAPDKFVTLMNKDRAKFRALSTQIDALHLERNGFNIKNRQLGGLVNLGLNFKNKSLKVMGQDLDNAGYTSKQDFYGEIEDVLRNKTQSDHASVNEAASMIRQHIDNAYANYRKAYNLPADWMPPRTAEGYLMRVYDTEYMNKNENEWVGTVGNWLKGADDTINSRMQPIRDMEDKIAAQTQKNEDLLTRPNVQDAEKKQSADELVAMKARHKALQEQLENDIRNDPDLALHAEDWNALSADEANKIKELTKRQNIALKEVNERKAIVAKIKSEIKNKKSAAIKSKTVKTGKENLKKSAETENVLAVEQKKLDEVLKEYEDESQKLQEKMHNGEIDPRLFYQEKGSFQYKFKDPNKRLKLRDPFPEGSVENPNVHREVAAKAYYDTIMNQTAEDTINQVMGKFTGNNSENHLKQRTLLVPDDVVQPFMTKDLMAKVSNYSTYLGRRTHLKNVFKDVTIDGGIEPILQELNTEHEQMRAPLNESKATLDEKLNNPDLSAADKKKIQSQIKSIDKQLDQRKRDFTKTKEQMNHIYGQMMGIQKYSRSAQKMKSAIMSMTAISNLPFVPFTMINDVSAIGLQHGMWPFIRDGVYPIIQSMAGLLKTKDSEALRKTAPSVHLALQDVLNAYADRNWGTNTNPYLNLGKWVHGLEELAHLSTNFTGTNYIDNGLQRITSAVSQSELMRILHEFKAGTMSKRDRQYILKYGIDPKEWADRMIQAFKEDGGGKTALGGYQSAFYQWKDLEAANKFGDAVFRAVKDTHIQSGIADSAFWTDSLLGSIVKGFNGWTYASINRYVIPALQQPDAQKLMGVAFMLGTGALVDPVRRMARGEDAIDPTMTDKQRLLNAFNNSGIFSYFSNILQDANVLTGEDLMGDLKSDRYKDRTRVGLLGPAFGTANKMFDIIDALGSGQWNKQDANKAARMIPFANASWTYWLSKKIIDGTSLPDTRAHAKALKEINQ